MRFRFAMSAPVILVICASAWSAPDFSICKIKNQGGQWAAPSASVHDMTCLHLLKMPQLEPSSSCRAQSLKDIYPDSDGKIESLHITRELPARGSELGRYGVVKRYEPEKAFSAGVDLEAHALRAGFCLQRAPERVREAFLEGYDVPAGNIDLWDEDYLRFKWEGRLPELMAPADDGKDPPVDYPTLFELNLDAARLWKRMVDCFDGSAEKAREAYFWATFSCTNPDADGMRLREDVATFVGNVENFFLSARFQEPQSRPLKRWELAELLEKGDKIAEVKIKPAPSLHPLFSEAALELLVRILPIGKSPSMEDWARRMQKEYPERIWLSVSQLFHLIPQPALNPMSLWPAISRSVYKVTVWSSQQMLYKATGYDFKVMDWGVQPTGVSEALLPYFYAKEAEKLALEMGQIRRRYLEPEKKPVKCTSSAGFFGRLFSGCDT